MHFVTGMAPIWDGRLQQQLPVCLVQSLHDEHDQKLKIHRQRASQCAAKGVAAFKKGETCLATPAFEACLCWTLLTHCWSDAQVTTALYNCGSSTASAEPAVAKKYLELAMHSVQDETQKMKYSRKLQEIKALLPDETAQASSYAAGLPSFAGESPVLIVQDLVAEMEATAAKLRALEVQLRAGEVVTPPGISTKKECQEWVRTRLGITDPWQAV
ncbi:unnamed protein product [Symbiodinium sp. CCMP2592]|nr:unnamed protein product [Symbiodinium sp. CCMP2592]